MSDDKPDLSTLLNDESFVGWLRGTSSTAEAKTWQQWHDESDHCQSLTSKAKKLLQMPFKTPEVTPGEVKKEIERFDEQFLRLINKPDS